MNPLSFSPGDLITFHQHKFDDRNIVRVVCRVEGNDVFVNSVHDHTFDVNTGYSTCRKRSFIKYISFDDAVDIIMKNPATVNCGRDRVEADLKERILKYKVHKLQSQ